MDELIWVDDNDNIIGYGEKSYTHRIGQLHRAFSVCICDLSAQTMLLQKRAGNKYHSATLWSNSCCSHFTKTSEPVVTQIKNSIVRELGVNASFNDVRTADIADTIYDKTEALIELGRFQYRCRLGKLYENEIDTVYLWGVEEKNFETSPCSDEVEEVKWATFKEIETDLCHSSEKYSFWFPKVFEIVKNYILLLKKYAEK